MSWLRLPNRRLLAAGERLAGHVAAIVAGIVLMVIGLAMGVTMVLLPAGLVIGIIGVLLVVWGLFERAKPGS